MSNHKPNRTAFQRFRTVCDGEFDLVCTGVVEHSKVTSCIEGAPGESGNWVSALDLCVRDTTSGLLHVQTVPESRAVGVKTGSHVHMYSARRGRRGHIISYHVLPAAA